MNSEITKALVNLPPTSSIIRNHILRSFFVIRNVLNLLNDQVAILNPIDHGWFAEDGVLLTVKGLKPVSDDFLTV